MFFSLALLKLLVKVRLHARSIVVLLSSAILVLEAPAGLVWSQNFDSVASINDLLDASENGFDRAQALKGSFEWVLVDGALEARSAGGRGRIIKQLDQPLPEGINYIRFRFDPGVISEEHGGAKIFVGIVEKSGFVLLDNRPQVFLQVNTHCFPNGIWKIRNASSGEMSRQSFKGTHEVTIVLNNASAGKEYDLGNTITGKLEPGTYHVFVDGTQVEMKTKEDSISMELTAQNRDVAITGFVIDAHAPENSRWRIEELSIGTMEK